VNRRAQAKAPIGDVGLKQIRMLAQLETVNLRKNKITDAGLEYLKGLANLRWLDVSYNEVTNVSVACALGSHPPRAVTLLGQGARVARRLHEALFACVLR
jgi:hypothetical protein